MNRPKTAGLSFAEAVGTVQTPEPRGGAQGTPGCVTVDGATASKTRSQPQKHSCSLCAYRSRSWPHMAAHPAPEGACGGVSPICPGAHDFRRSYACALNMHGWPDQRTLEHDLCSAAQDDVPVDEDSPDPELPLPMSVGAPSAAAEPQQDLPSLGGCAANLAEIYGRLWLSTNPTDIGDLVSLGGT